MRQRLGQKMRRTHPRFERAEGMLDRLSPYPHRGRGIVESLLDALHGHFVFRARDAAFVTRRTARFERTLATDR